jgi:hypothetical protein
LFFFFSSMLWGFEAVRRKERDRESLSACLLACLLEEIGDGRGRQKKNGMVMYTPSGVWKQAGLRSSTSPLSSSSSSS